MTNKLKKLDNMLTMVKIKVNITLALAEFKLLTFKITSRWLSVTDSAKSDRTHEQSII